MKTQILTLLAVAIIGLTGCTEQQRAKQYGGSHTEKLPAGQKLLNITWKETELWMLTRPMTTNDVPETYTFKESSSWGLVEGSITLVESR